MPSVFSHKLRKEERVAGFLGTLLEGVQNLLHSVGDCVVRYP